MRAHRRSAIETTFSGGDEIACIYIRARAINFCHATAGHRRGEQPRTYKRGRHVFTCARERRNAKDDNITRRSRFVHSNTRALHARAA